MPRKQHLIYWKTKNADLECQMQNLPIYDSVPFGILVVNRVLIKISVPFFVACVQILWQTKMSSNWLYGNVLTCALCNRHHICFMAFSPILLNRKQKRCIFGQKSKLEKKIPWSGIYSKVGKIQKSVILNLLKLHPFFS